MLEHLQPSAVFSYFEEICNIPHGSYNIGKISDYLVTFAKTRNLAYTQDKVGNVIIVKEATSGYEEKEPVIIQGHMDMVAVKEDDRGVEALAALQVVGYNKKEIEKVCEKIDTKNLEIEEIIKQALKYLARN